MGLGKDICFDEFLLNLQLNEEMYILALCSTLQKPTLFLKRKPNDIQTNVYGKHVGPLWEANIDAQFILDPSTVISYCTSYLTKVDKSITQKMQLVLEKYKYEQTKTFEHIKKLGNAFLNPQQMSDQQAIHKALSIPLYHATRLFQFIDTCEEENKAFILFTQKN